MTQSTSNFLAYLDNIGVLYKYTERHGRSDIISFRYKLDNGRAVEVIAFFEPDGKNAAFRCYMGLSPTPSKRLKALEFINSVNQKYRCVKLYLDEDELAAGCDVLLPTEDTGGYCYRYLELFIYVLNEVYEKAVNELIK